MIQSVTRAIRLLETLDRAGTDGLALSSLAREVELKPPTAHNLLRTLAASGYVCQNPESRRYLLGPRALELGSREHSVQRLTAAAGRPLKELRRQIDETVLVTLWEDGRRRTLLCIESAQPLRVAAMPGMDRALYSTATGRVLLSGLPEDDLRKVWKRLGPPGTRWSAVSSQADLRNALEQIRQDGLACLEKPTAHIHALAVPIISPDGEKPAALGLYYPSVRDTPQRRTELVDALQHTAGHIGKQWKKL